VHRAARGSRSTIETILFIAGFTQSMVRLTIVAVNGCVEVIIIKFPSIATFINIIGCSRGIRTRATRGSIAIGRVLSVGARVLRITGRRSSKSARVQAIAWCGIVGDWKCP